MNVSAVVRLALVSSIFLMAAPLAQAGAEIRIGIDRQDIRSGRIDIESFVADLERRFLSFAGRVLTVKPVILPSDRSVLDGLLDGSIDVSRMDPAAYLVNKPVVPKLRLLALEQDSAGGEAETVICVRAENPIDDLRDLYGKSIAFGAENSARGQFLPQQRLAKSGIKAFRLSRYVYVAQQRKVGLGVAAGVFDAGVIDKSTFRKMLREGRRLRSVAELGRVDRPWVAGPRVPGELAVFLSRALPGMSFDSFAFVAASEQDLADVGRAMADNPRFFNHAPI